MPQTFLILLVDGYYGVVRAGFMEMIEDFWHCLFGDFQICSSALSCSSEIVGSF
jgi:hypothetical protein